MNSVSYVFSNYVKATMRTYFYNTLSIRLLYCCGLLPAILTIVALVSGYYDVKGLFMGGFLPIILLITYISSCYIAPAKLEKDKRYQSIHTLTFDEEGLRMKSDVMDAKVGWSMLHKVWETQQFYFLFHDKRQYWFIPKERFADASQEAAFRDLALKYSKVQTGLNK